MQSEIKRDYHLEKVTPYSYWSIKEYEGFIPRYLSRYGSYILSRNAMTTINNTFSINNLKFINKTFIYEDIMVALILKSKNIIPYELKYGIKFSAPLLIKEESVDVHVNNDIPVWIFIGNEGDSFTLPLNSHIRFGSADKWVETKTTTHSFKGSIRFFKADPLYGAKKEIHYNIYSEIEGTHWIKIGYENSTITLPVKGRLSFGNENDGWIEKFVSPCSFVATAAFFKSSVSYTHRNMVRLFVQYLW
jgi:hypothetical protein